MNKKELLEDLKNRAMCNGFIGQERLIEVKEDDSRLYGQVVRTLNGKSAAYINVAFYVVDEGLMTEAAYYQNNEPAEYNPLSEKRFVNFPAMVRKNKDRGVPIYTKLKESVSKSDLVKIIFDEISGQYGTGFDVSNADNKTLINGLVKDGVLNETDKAFIFSFLK